MRFTPFAWILALGGLLAVAPLAAQQSPVVGTAEMDAALESRAGSVDADRAAVRRVLERPEVAQVADQFGVDIEDARAAVGALEGERLTQAAELSASVEQALAGGQTFSISTITLILILLLVIIVILIAE